MEFAELIKTTRVDNVILRRHRHSPVEGTLCLTSHHMIFSSRSGNNDELTLLYVAVETLGKDLTGNTCVLTILCKNFTTFKLRIPGVESANNVAATIEALSNLESAMSYYPFFHRLTFTIVEEGWDAHKLQSEYASLIGDSKHWRVCSVNSQFKVCNSYPTLVVVPAAATDDMIIKSAAFRQDGRFPVLAYLHQKNLVPIMRCSQPLSGPSNKRCKEDEKLLGCVLAGHGKKGNIVDTRTSSVAAAQKSKGGGQEADHHYPQWKRHFQNLNRPLLVAESMLKLHDACVDTKSSSWLSKLEASGWLTNIEGILSAALHVVRYVDVEGSPVLIHGDRGSDCTLQVTSLAQLLLDPGCRSIKGFQSMVVREWLWAGYPFTERHSKLGVATSKRKTHAPVFLMFLDCVNQVRAQYPTSFEFTEHLLLLLAEHSYASEFGTFLFNTECERIQSKVAASTISFWSYVNRDEVLRLIRNPLYEEYQRVLLPSVAPQSLSIWKNFFLRSRVSSTDADHKMMSIITEVKSTNDELKTRARRLQKEYIELRQKVLAKRQQSEAVV